jgi:hypothetical protein
LTFAVACLSIVVDDTVVLILMMTFIPIDCWVLMMMMMTFIDANYDDTFIGLLVNYGSIDDGSIVDRRKLYVVR